MRAPTYWRDINITQLTVFSRHVNPNGSESTNGNRRAGQRSLESPSLTTRPPLTQTCTAPRVLVNASNINPKNSAAYAESSHRTINAIRETGSIHMNELPAPMPK